MKTSFYTIAELDQIGFRRVGAHVLISRKASVYSPHLMEIGDHVRVDDFCILSGRVNLGSYIHVSAYTALYAHYGITIGDYATISGRVLIYSQNDDYSGAFMTNPMVPEKYTHVEGGPVCIEKHAIIGAGTIILPDLTIGEGACIGAMSLLKTNALPWTVYVGIPAKPIGSRQKGILDLEQQFLGEREDNASQPVL